MASPGSRPIPKSTFIHQILLNGNETNSFTICRFSCDGSLRDAENCLSCRSYGHKISKTMRRVYHPQSPGILQLPPALKELRSPANPSSAKGRTKHRPIHREPTHPLIRDCSSATTLLAPVSSGRVASMLGKSGVDGGDHPSAILMRWFDPVSGLVKKYPVKLYAKRLVDMLLTVSNLQKPQGAPLNWLMQVAGIKRMRRLQECSSGSSSNSCRLALPFVRPSIHIHPLQNKETEKTDMGGWSQRIHFPLCNSRECGWITCRETEHKANARCDTSAKPVILLP
jgi:hypothetical protein